jgi:hypothetical protein
MKTYFELAAEMSKSDLRELESRLTVLIEYLLKLAHVTGRAAKDNQTGWNQTVGYQREDLALHFEQNQGLKSKLTHAMLDKVYRSALATVRKEYAAV